MRSDWSAYPLEARRTAQVVRHPSASPAEVMRGTAADGVDLSPWVESARHSSAEASVRLRWHSALYGSAQPAPGEVLELVLDGQTLWIGIIESASDYRERRGERVMQVTARSRDAGPQWREVRRVTDIYPVGTEVDRIARAVATAVGLEADEQDLPQVSLRTPHSGTQLADLTAWQMLETLLLPVGLAPWVDALGVLRAIDRDITRAPDQVLGRDRVRSVTGSRARAPLTALRLRWLDPQLTRVSQQDQPLATATIQAGFFKLLQERDVYWSEDRTQRADNSRMVVKQSVNGGLLPVGSESYRQVSPTQGRVTVETSAWVPGLATASIAGLLAASHLPDYAPPGGGPTVPTGKIVHGAAEVAIMLIMMSLGVGVYEIRGEPYDYVHARNTTEAYDGAAPAWRDSPEEVESDLILDEEHAQAVAVRELFYRAAAAQTWTAELVDDPRIEVGDILELPDGSRLYVLDYRRDLTRGAAAVLTVEGFRA